MRHLRSICICTALFILSLLTSSPLAAQPTGTVAGRVVDDDGTALPGVNVLLQRAEMGTTTDSTGAFRIRNVPTGPDTLHARFVGYESARRPLEIAANQTVQVELTMSPDVVEMRGIEVTSLQPGLEPSGTLEQQDIRKAEVADPGALLRDLPGVGAVRRGAMGLDPNVRGLAETQVGVYVGGMRTFPAGPARMDSPMSHVDPSTIASIDVVKGPYALTWGPGNMSAIRVEQRGEDPPRTPVTGSVHTGYDTNYEAVETTGFAMGRRDAWFYSASGA